MRSSFLVSFCIRKCLLYIYIYVFFHIFILHQSILFSGDKLPVLLRVAVNFAGNMTDLGKQHVFDNHGISADRKKFYGDSRKILSVHTCRSSREVEGTRIPLCIVQLGQVRERCARDKKHKSN